MELSFRPIQHLNTDHTLSSFDGLISQMINKEGGIAMKASKIARDRTAGPPRLLLCHSGVLFSVPTAYTVAILKGCLNPQRQ